MLYTEYGGIIDYIMMSTLDLAFQATGSSKSTHCVQIRLHVVYQREIYLRTLGVYREIYLDVFF